MPPQSLRRTLLELFVVGNIGFLAVDIWLAHSVNDFRHGAEWIPFYFSLLAPPVLLAELAWTRWRGRGPILWVGGAVGALSILVGIAGLVLHLESHFFAEQTLHSLVYTAPFAAPLAYAGLGFLLLLNRMIDVESLEWGQWLLFLALGGFAGNFALSLADHAQNGFWHLSEWIPVFASAYAVGFLAATVLVARPSRGFIDLCLVVMVVQAVVGILGFYLHGTADYGGPAQSFLQNLIHGAPIFAPLLFVNLAALAAFGLWDVRAKVAA